MAVPFSTQQNYIDDFNPVDYYKTYYNPAEGKALTEWTDFALKVLHDTFKKGCVEGDTLIDIGSGPTIYQLLSACEVFNNIIPSDYLPQNIAELQKWFKKQPGALDWTPYIKQVCELEGNRISCEEKAEKLRSKVKQILRCDVLKKNPFEPLNVAPADCVLSSLCLEGPCKDMETFTAAITHLRDLVKPGGHLVILSVLNSKCYYVGDKYFTVLPCTKEGVEKAFKDAGYEIVDMKFSSRNDLSELHIASHDSHYYVRAIKPK
ncbi:nicotinamide N-methyltransferase-like [Gastrophryne carolinensis]